MEERKEDDSKIKHENREILLTASHVFNSTSVASQRICCNIRPILGRDVNIQRTIITLGCDLNGVSSLATLPREICTLPWLHCSGHQRPCILHGKDVHSFITWIYIAPLRDYYSEALKLLDDLKDKHVLPDGERRCGSKWP